MQDFQAIPQKTPVTQDTIDAGLLAGSERLAPYLERSETFQKQVKAKLDAGEKTVRVAFGAHGSKVVTVDLRRLQQVEEKYRSLIQDKHLSGYVPPNIYCGLKAFYSFLPGTGKQSVQEAEVILEKTVRNIRVLIQDGVPSFRVPPKYESLKMTDEGRVAYFPLADYIIYFGAEMLASQAQSKRGTGENSILPVTSEDIRLFSEKAVVNGTLDQAFAKHLARVTREKFFDDAVAEEIVQRSLRVGNFLAVKFRDFSQTQRPRRELPEDLTPRTAYECISSTCWYLHYSDSDRIRIASSYAALAKHAQLAEFTSRQIKSFYEAASLILDDLPAPSTFTKLRSSSKKATPKSFDSHALAELSTMLPSTVEQNQWGEIIATQVRGRLAEFDSNGSPEALMKIFFGNWGSVLSAIEVSTGLDRLEEIKSAIDQGRIALLSRLGDDVLRDVLARAKKHNIAANISSCGGPMYRQAAKTRFNPLKAK